LHAILFVWPNTVATNSHTFQTGHFADILPTICDAAGIAPSEIENIDGKSLVPVLKGGTIKERTLLWQMDLYTNFQNQGEKPKPYATSVALKGNMKLLADSLQPVELFDLTQDHREIYNLLKEREEVTDELQKEIKKYHAESRLECCI